MFVPWLPLYHDMGLIGAWMGSLYFAVPLVLMSPLAFLNRPARWLRAIDRYRGTLSGGPNFAYELCTEKRPTTAWRAWTCPRGASPSTVPSRSRPALERFPERFAPYGSPARS